MKKLFNYWPLSVIAALYYLILSLIGIAPENRRKVNYLIALFLNADRFLNALFGGNYQLTVSGRIGKLAYHYRKRNEELSGTGKLINKCEDLINWAFFHTDGPDHCFNAYLWELYEIGSDIEHKHGNPIVILLASPLLILICLTIKPFNFVVAKI